MTALVPADPPGAMPEKAHVAAEFNTKRPLIACRFDPLGRFVYASDEDDRVQRFDLAAPKPAEAQPTVYAGHESWVFALAFPPKGDTLLTGGGDGRIIWWPAAAEKPQPIRSIKGHQGWVRALAVSPDGTIVASCGNDHVVRLWSFAEGRLLMELPGHDRPVYRLMFTPDGKTLLSADLRGVVIAWDYRPGKEQRRLDAAKLYKYEGGQGVDYGGVRDMTLSRDGKYLACGGLIDASNPLGAVSTPAVLVFDWATGSEAKLQRPKEDAKGLVWSLRFHPDGYIIAATGGTGGGALWFFRPDSTNEFAKFALPNTARDMDLHPDTLRIATAHHDARVRITLLRPKAG
ncbi:MAG: WD40 repeat domain-containing protein [Isosphaeraceae bacterium]